MRARECVCVSGGGGGAGGGGVGGAVAKLIPCQSRKSLKMKGLITKVHFIPAALHEIRM